MDKDALETKLIQARDSSRGPSWVDITNRSLHSFPGSGHSLGTFCLFSRPDQPIRIS